MVSFHPLSSLHACGDHIHPAQTTITGNAATAMKLQTAMSINEVPFDGSANITITQVNGKDIVTTDQIPSASRLIASATVSDSITDTVTINNLDILTHGRYKYVILMPSSSYDAAIISMFANGDTARANYNCCHDNIGNNTAAGYMGMRNPNHRSYSVGEIDLIPSGPLISVGMTYYDYNSCRVGWGTNGNISNLTSLTFKSQKNDLANAIIFPIATKISIYRAD